jgi:hypothetical protein
MLHFQFGPAQIAACLHGVRTNEMMCIERARQRTANVREILQCGGAAVPQPRQQAAGVRRQRSTPTAMLRPVNSAMVGICAISFANSASFDTASITLPYTSQLE